MLRSIIHDLISSGRNDWTRDSGKKFNKTGQEMEERETGNLAQPNLDGISCIISNIQFHLEKKPDKSPERESKISRSSRRLFRCWTPRHLLFRYFSYQVDKGFRCLTPSLAHLFSGCELSFILDLPFLF